MIVYASEYKHSISNDIYFLVNPDPNSKNKVLKHIKIKEYMKLKDRSKMLKLIQRVTPNTVNLTINSYISQSIGYTKFSLNKKGDKSASGKTKSTIDTDDPRK